ncbi:hypothetical protein BDDG_11982 [Blastomyces dermatitidis ATCC 18188]|uniref:Uncharacterized protein n=1 Tax=Ajellomyces dermatitidis (strain ATCC 18188 / CBS 674.68) TaxID=653446 RepID=A0A0J9EMA5_AJEDA|nr:hypothetical protein BDDG_11982 [Blastomyces dermatitidis ATCC 18188]
MRDFEMQIDLTEKKQQKLFSEKAVKRDFEMIIISDEKEKKKKKEEEEERRMRSEFIKNDKKNEKEKK